MIDAEDVQSQKTNFVFLVLYMYIAEITAQVSVTPYMPNAIKSIEIKIKQSIEKTIIDNIVSLQASLKIPFS